jgi:hypothetical protein
MTTPHKDDSLISIVDEYCNVYAKLLAEPTIENGEKTKEAWLKAKAKLQALIAKAVQEARKQDHKNLAKTLYKHGVDITVAPKILADLKPALQANKDES